MKTKFKLRDIIKKFFNFNLANFDIWIHVWKDKPSFFSGNYAEEFAHTKGTIPERYENLECNQVEFSVDPAKITFFCSENDEDW